MSKEEDRKAFLNAIDAVPWDRGETPRGVYADWLDEHDEPEEANRQRAWVPAMKALREFAKACPDETFNGAYDDHDNPDDYENGFSCFMRYLAAHLDALEDPDGVHLNFVPPCTGEFFYSPEMWDNFEIVTGRKVPEEVRGYTDPQYFQCGC